MRATVAVLLIACGNHDRAPDPTPAPAPTPRPVATIDRAALLEGALPDGPGGDIINAQCRICHAVEYLTQQRLGEAGWKKTIDKMRTFGANLDDAQAQTVVTFATRYWNPELPGRTWKPVAPPPGALPTPATEPNYDRDR